VFAANGFDLVLTARRSERLEAVAARLAKLHGVRTRVLPADLADPRAPAALIHQLEVQGVSVDVLVNNAGYGVAARYREADWSVHRDFLQVMVTAPCELTHRLIGSMTRRGYGRILNVASVAGLMPGSANHTLYGAAKSLMIKFSEALHNEQAGSGVHVTALCPGFTLTEFHDVNNTRRAMSGLPRFMWLTAERVALDGYDAVMRNRAISVPGAPYKLIVAMVRMLPLALALHIGAAREKLLKEEDSSNA
jgi:short-subunit dehydrogenase